MPSVLWGGRQTTTGSVGREIVGSAGDSGTPDAFAIAGSSTLGRVGIARFRVLIGGALDDAQ